MPTGYANVPLSSGPMNEAEWLTRRKRIDTKLRSLNPAWQIIPWREGLDVSKLSCHAVTEFPTEVREQLIKNLTIDEDDFDNTPLLQGRGGAAKAKRVFGELNLLVAQLNEAVAA